MLYLTVQTVPSEILTCSAALQDPRSPCPPCPRPAGFESPGPVYAVAAAARADVARVTRVVVAHEDVTAPPVVPIC
jgi:hypothetical protein